MMTRLIPPALALAFALSCSAVWGEPTDWGLEAPGRVTICAVDQKTCREALGLMRDGKLFVDLPREGWVCRPHPGCRPEGDLCIRRYNCK
jgi:hypothetical protein